jgi:hypothetical protein
MALITRSASRKAFKFSSLPTELRLMIWTETFEPRIQDMWTQHIAGRLPSFGSLEMLILVIEREVGGNGKELIRVNMESELVEARDRLVLQGGSKEWKPPVVKVMTRRAFENCW